MAEVLAHSSHLLQGSSYVPTSHLPSSPSQSIASQLSGCARSTVSNSEGNNTVPYPGKEKAIPKSWLEYVVMPLTMAPSVLKRGKSIFSPQRTEGNGAMTSLEESLRPAIQKEQMHRKEAAKRGVAETVTTSACGSETDVEGNLRCGLATTEVEHTTNLQAHPVLEYSGQSSAHSNHLLPARKGDGDVRVEVAKHASASADGGSGTNSSSGRQWLKQYRKGLNRRLSALVPYTASSSSSSSGDSSSFSPFSFRFSPASSSSSSSSAANSSLVLLSGCVELPKAGMNGGDDAAFCAENFQIICDGVGGSKAPSGPFARAIVEQIAQRLREQSLDSSDGRALSQRIKQGVAAARVQMREEEEERARRRLFRDSKAADIDAGRNTVGIHNENEEGGTNVDHAKEASAMTDNEAATQKGASVSASQPNLDGSEQNRLDSTLSVCYIDAQARLLHTFTVGDSKTILIRDGKIADESTCLIVSFNVPVACSTHENHDFTPFLLHERFSIQRGDVVVTFSDGVSDNLFSEEICEVVRHARCSYNEKEARMDFPSFIATELAMEAKTRSQEETLFNPFCYLATKAYREKLEHKLRKEGVFAYSQSMDYGRHTSRGDNSSTDVTSSRSNTRKGTPSRNQGNDDSMLSSTRYLRRFSDIPRRPAHLREPKNPGSETARKSPGYTGPDPEKSSDNTSDARRSISGSSGGRLIRELEEVKRREKLILFGKRYRKGQFFLDDKIGTDCTSDEDGEYSRQDHKSEKRRISSSLLWRLGRTKDGQLGKARKESRCDGSSAWNGRQVLEKSMMLNEKAEYYTEKMLKALSQRECGKEDDISVAVTIVS